MAHSLVRLACLCAIAAVAACGQVNNARPDASLQSDALEQPRCDPLQPFAAPTLVNGVNTDATEWGAQLTADELLIFFSSNRPGSDGFDIYWAKRSTRDGSFDAPVRLTSVDTVANERSPSPTADGLTLYFFRDNDIYVTTRGSRDSEFGVATPVSAINTAAAENDVYVTASGLYFNRLIASDNSEILRSRRLPSGDLAAPEVVAELDLPNTFEGRPVLSVDETQIFWYSSRLDGGHVGGNDVWTASRASTTEAFGNQTNVTALNSVDADAPNWLSRDGCILYFESNRLGGIGGTDLYVARRPR